MLAEWWLLGGGGLRAYVRVAHTHTAVLSDISDGGNKLCQSALLV